MPGAVKDTKNWQSSMSSGDAKDSKRLEDPASSISRLRPILGLELTEAIPLEKVYVGRLKEKRNISKAIQLISVASPGFGHLKRCSGFRLLLSPVRSSIEELKAELTSKGFDFSLLEDEIEELDLPAKPSKTKRQAEVCGKLWPVNFHPDQTTESIISGDLFTDDQLSLMELLMRLAVDAARIESVGNSECNGSALIVDPDTGQPLALASSKLDEHPLFHAAMLAIDLVAKIQGGGAWDLTNDKQKIANVPEGGMKRKLDPGIPLRYPPSLANVVFPESLEPLEKSRQKIARKDESVSSARKDSSLIETTKTGPYLCTNYWIFLVQEPCALCAMALLHSRASKIFYGVGTKAGVLGSKSMLHTTPGLNHRYQVWSGILEKECKAVCEEMKIRELKSG